MRLPLSVRLVAPDSSVSRPLMATPSWQRGTPVLTPTPALTLTLTLTPTLTLTLILTRTRTRTRTRTLTRTLLAGEHVGSTSVRG